MRCVDIRSLLFELGLCVGPLDEAVSLLPAGAEVVIEDVVIKLYVV